FRSKEAPNSKKAPTDKPDGAEKKPKPTSTPPKGTEEKPKKKPPTKTDGDKPAVPGQPTDDGVKPKTKPGSGKLGSEQPTDEENPAKKKKKKPLEKKSTGPRDNLVRSMTRAAGFHESDEGRILF